MLHLLSSLSQLFCGSNHIDTKRNTMKEPLVLYSLENLDNFLFLQRVISKEKMEGRRLVSSIESLTFSVTSEDDIVVTVKCVEGCQLDESASQLVNFFLLYFKTTNVSDM